MQNNRLSGLLVSLSGYPQVPSNFMPDNGLAGLAAVIKSLNHDVVIWDLNTPSTMRRLFPPAIRAKLTDYADKLQCGEPLNATDFESLKPIQAELERYQQNQFKLLGKEISDFITKRNIHWFGLKIWNGDGYTASKTISEIVKQDHPRLPIIAGGPHADYFMEYLLQSTPTIDFIAFAEGEETMPHFLDFVGGTEQIENVPNLLYRKGAELRRTRMQRVEDLDQLPLPIYDEETYPAMAGNQKW